MRIRSLAALASWTAFVSLRQVHAISNLTFYSDELCQEAISVEDGPDDGTCTAFSSQALQYHSFRVTSLDQTCAVTVYGSDIAFCSSATLFVAPFSDCMTNASIGQFSVDCQDYNTAISSEPQVYDPNATNEPTSTASSSDGLSGGAKAGIAVAAAAAGLGLVALLVWVVLRNNRRKRRNLANLVPEADSTPAAPPYSELAHTEKKAPVELPPQAMVPVEAPGDHHWPLRELEGSSPPGHRAEKSAGELLQPVSDLTTVVGSESNPNISVSSNEPRTPAAMSNTDTDAFSPVSPAPQKYTPT